MARFVERDSPDALTAQEIVDQLGSYLAARYQAAETYLLEQIARRAAADLDTANQARRLAAVRALQADAVRVLDAIDSEALARQVVNVAIAEGSAAAVEQIGLTAAAAGSSATAVLNGQALPFATGLTTSAATAAAQIGLELSNALGDVRQRVLRAVPDLYQQVVADTVGERLLGTMTGRQSRRLGLERALDAGLTGFTDAAGRRWRMGTYTEMATRTATNRAWIAAHVTKWQSIGLNLVTIVRGVDACKPCAEWSGRVLSTDGTPAGPVQAEHATTGEPVTVDVAGTLDDARAGGWNHPNCRCTLAPVFPGLSLPANESTYDPQQERDRERLRYLERRTRDFKRREQVARAMGDDVAAARWRRAGLAEQGRIRDHVAATGQLRKPYREALSFADGAPRNLPPTPPTVIVPDVPTPPPPGAGAAARAAQPETPAWLAEHQAIVARLPERDQIGFVTRNVSADEVERQYIAGLERSILKAPVTEVRTQLAAMDARIGYFDDLARAYDDRPDLTTARAWPADLKDLATAAGVGRRQPRSFTANAFQRGAREQNGVRGLYAKRLDEFEAEVERRRRIGYKPETAQVNDLTPDGNLGRVTAAALDDTIAAGRIVDDEIERRLLTAPDAPANPSPEVYSAAKLRAAQLQTRYYQAMSTGDSTFANRLKAELDEALTEARDLWEQRNAYDNWATAQRRRITLEVLGDTRPYGAGTRPDYRVIGANVDGLEDAMYRAHEHYPSAWNERARDFNYSPTLEATDRGFNRRGQHIALSFDPRRGGFEAVATHELGHTMEITVPGVRGLEWALHYRRSEKVADAAGNVTPVAARPLGSGYGVGEVHVPGEWSVTYAGKVYPERGEYGAGTQYEVLTLAVESLFDGSPYFDLPDGSTDVEYRRWLLGVLSSV